MKFMGKRKDELLHSKKARFKREIDIRHQATGNLS